MRINLSAVLWLYTIIASAQLDTVQPGVYNWKEPVVNSNESKKSINILEGVSPHFEYINIHATTQLPGAKPSKQHANDDAEECIIIKEGQMKVTIEGKTTILGPQDVILLLPKQLHSLENIGDSNLTYYVMKYKSKNKMDLERGKHAGGSLVINKDSLTVSLSSKGSGSSYFDRPTTMCERFEMHTTQLNKKGPSHNPHTHLETEIILMLSGETEMTIDGKEFRAKEGDFYFISSGLLHGVRNAIEKPCSYFAFKWK